MTSGALLAGLLALIGMVIALVPRAIKEFVILITALVGGILLLSAPLMVIALLFRLEGLENWLNDHEFFKMMVAGIVIVCVMGLFHQEWVKEVYPDGIPDD